LQFTIIVPLTYLSLKCNIHNIDTNYTTINYTCIQWWFQNKMHHMLGVLRFKFTIPLLFWILSFCMYWFGLLQQTTHSMTWLLTIQPNYTTSHVHALLLKIIYSKGNHHFIFGKNLVLYAQF